MTHLVHFRHQTVSECTFYRMDTAYEDKTPYQLRRDHKRLTIKLALTIAATLVFAWLSLAKMNSRTPVTELGTQMLYVYWALTAWFIICWRRLHRRRESCREVLADIDALPSPAVWALPILTALVGAAGGVVATMVSKT